MKIQKIENDKQKLILISLIISDLFCKKIIPILVNNKEILYQNFDNYYIIIIQWIIDYYNKHQKAPGKHIQELFEFHKNKYKNEEKELISNFIKHLSNKYEKEENYNEQFIIDLALEYLREINLNYLQKNIDILKSQNKLNEAEQLIFSYRKIEAETRTNKTLFIYNDIDEATNICNTSNTSQSEGKLFKFKGELGERIGYVCREDFFCFVGVPKIGKSFGIRETAVLCKNQGLNVVIFNLEMSHNKYALLLYQNIINEVKSTYNKENIKIKFPFFEKDVLTNKFNIKYEEKNRFGISNKKIKGILQRNKIKQRGDIVLKSYPSGTLYFNKMVQDLNDLALDGFVVDVALIDFVDNLKDSVKGDYRHSINEKWLLSRRLAQEKHIAVGTVSHATKKNFKKDLQKGDVNEDYRKEAHVTHMFGINQTEEDKENLVCRINILHNRDQDCNSKEIFLCLEQRNLGRFMIDSKSIKNVNYLVKRDK